MSRALISKINKFLTFVKHRYQKKCLKSTWIKESFYVPFFSIVKKRALFFSIFLSNKSTSFCSSSFPKIGSLPFNLIAFSSSFVLFFAPDARQDLQRCPAMRPLSGIVTLPTPASSASDRWDTHTATQLRGRYGHGTQQWSSRRLPWSKNAWVWHI